MSAQHERIIPASGPATDNRFYFLRAEIPEGKRGAVAFWKEQTGEARPTLQFTLKPVDAVRPYHPLLDLVRARYLELPPEQARAALDAVEVHHRHRHIFRDWLETGYADREDDLFRAPAEIDWERGRLFQSLTDLIDRLWDTDTAPLLILENFELAGLPLVHLLLWMIEHDRPRNLRFVCVFNRDSVLVSHWTAEFRQRFFNCIEERDLIRHFPVDIPVEHDPGHINTSPPELLNDIALSRCFIAYEEAHAIPAALGSLPPFQAITAGYLIGIINVLVGDIKKALLFLAKALETARQTGNEPMIARINAAIALCHSRSSNFPAIEKHMTIARKTAQDCDNQSLVLSMEYMRFMVHESFTANPANWSELGSLIARLKAAGMTDHLLDLKSNISYYESCIVNAGWETAYREALESLSLAESVDNLFQASKLHHVVAFLCQMKNRNDEAVKHFDSCIAIRRVLGAQDELVRAFNGVGYLCFTIGRFKASLAYFEDSLELLEPQKAYSETCLTLFNIVNIYFFTGRFSGALDIMERILDVLDNLKKDSLPFHSRRKLYSFAGCAAWLRNQKTLALDYWNAARSSPTDDHSGAICPLLDSFISRMMNNELASEHALAKAFETAEQDNQSYFLIFLLLVRACLRRDTGDTASAAADFTRAQKLADTIGLEEQKELLLFLKNGGLWKDFHPAVDPDGRIRAVSIGLTDSARQEAANLNLLKKLSDISFLKDFQDSITRDLEEKQLFKTAINLIKRTFPFSGIYFLEDRVNPLLREASPRKRRIPAAWHWNRLFGTVDAHEAVLLTDPAGGLLAYPFSYNAEQGLWAVLTTGEDGPTLSTEETEIATLALRHLDLTLDLHRAKEALKNAASRDNLTGALSRQEFMSRVEQERSRLERYSRSGDTGFAILFMDLDNFKFYNDEYGHPAGDCILQLFARLLRHCIRDLDSLGRFGGDEFIIMLPATGTAGAKRVAERILESLRKAEGFKKELEDELGYRVSIPAGSQLGCSIGITLFETAEPVPVNQLVEQADKALYLAKNAGKGCLRFFEKTGG